MHFYSYKKRVLEFFVINKKGLKLYTYFNQTDNILALFVYLTINTLSESADTSFVTEQ